MAGTISLSFSQRVDNQTGEPLSGGRLYFFAAGTTTPQSAYHDVDLTIPHPNPIVLDSGGNIPQFFLADGQIKIRLENEFGVSQLAADNVLVIGPSSGGGGGGGVDPTTIISTGYIIYKYGVGTLTGFVRCNARTIGSATSGATERANSDTEFLFKFLWDADANLAVSGGRGGSAAADWSANKTIALPDGRGRALAGLDDMGNSAASILTTTNFGTSPIVLGAKGGAEKRTVGQTHLPAVNLSAASLVASTSINNGDSVHRGNGSSGTVSMPGGYSVYRTEDIAIVNLTATTGISGVVPLGGGGVALPTVSPYLLVTTYIKL